MLQRPFFKAVAEPLETDGDESTYSEHQCYLRLWAAKLIVHVKDYKAWDSYVQSNKKLSVDKVTELKQNRRAADHWIHDPFDGIGSFIWICGLFNVDPERARRTIKTGVFEL